MDLSADICRIAVVTADDGTTIRVQGDVDLASAPLLEAALGSADGQSIVVDLSEMTFCDGAGLRVLDLAHQRLGTRLQLTGVSPFLRRLATVLDMDWLVGDMPEPGIGVRTPPS